MTPNELTSTLISDVDDPLLDCLLIMMSLYNKHFTKQELLAGLPLINNKLNPSLFIRAAERAGLMAKIINRPLNKISKLVLPAVLILKNNQCCVLKKFNEDNTAEILLAEAGVEHAITRSLAELEENYAGYAILVQPVSSLPPVSEITPKFHSWFWSTLWRYRFNYSEVLMAAFLINLFALVAPLFVMNVYDRVVPNNALITLWTLAIGVLIIYICDLILRFLRGYLIDVSGKKADVLLASSLFQQVLTMEMRHKPGSTGGFVNGLREFETVRDFFTSATLTTLIDLPFIFLYIIAIGYIGGAIVLVPLIAVPIILGMAWTLQKPLFQTVKQSLQSASIKHGILVESVGALEIIKGLGAEGLFQRKYEEAVGQNANLGLKSRFLSSIVMNVTYFLQQLVTVFVVVIGVYQIEKGAITLGGLIACSILSGRMLAPLGAVMGLITRYEQARYALQGLNKIMELPSENDIARGTVHRETMQGNLEFKNVSFEYPEHSIKALDNIVMKVKAGERIGIIGKIGSGKTTLQRLLLGLYKPQNGTLYVDDIDVNQWPLADLRGKIGYVPQDTLLFAGTVRDNIAMGHPWADDAAILAAARLSGADRFISHNPVGYGMLVGERGAGLSGGQRQTIAIARALLGNPSVLLFDEPSSSMDDALEQEWIANMKSYLTGKTLLLITHKPQLLALVNRIIVMDAGKIIIDGPKEKVFQLFAEQQQQKNQQGKPSEPTKKA